MVAHRRIRLSLDGRCGRCLPGLVLLSILTSGSGARAAADADSLCYGSVSLEPSWAYLEQQVLYRVRIFRREDVSEVNWLEPLSFPSFRAEWLPGRSPDRRIFGTGSHFLVFEERRALFPLRPGRLSIPSATLRCTVLNGSERHDVTAPVPSVSLEVKPLPEAGRPPEFSGVVGRVEILATLGQRRVRLGEAVPLTVTVRGVANVWRARTPLPEALEEARIDVFQAPPKLSLDPGARLSARLSLRFDLVPHERGRVQIPSISLPYFDPELGRYALAETGPLEVEVAPRASARGRAGVSTSDSNAGRGTPREGRSPPDETGAQRSRLGWVIAALLLPASAAALLWKISRPGAAARRALRKDFSEAEGAYRRGEASVAASVLARAVRRALESRMPGIRGQAPEEILQRTRAQPAAEAAARLLLDLERTRFAAGRSSSGTARLPDLREVRKTLRAL